MKPFAVFYSYITIESRNDLQHFVQGLAVTVREMVMLSWVVHHLSRRYAYFHAQATNRKQLPSTGIRMGTRKSSWPMVRHLNNSDHSVAYGTCVYLSTGSRGWTGIRVKNGGKRFVLLGKPTVF